MLNPPPPPTHPPPNDAIHRGAVARLYPQVGMSRCVSFPLRCWLSLLELENPSFVKWPVHLPNWYLSDLTPQTCWLLVASSWILLVVCELVFLHIIWGLSKNIYSEHADLAYSLDWLEILIIRLERSGSSPSQVSACQAPPPAAALLLPCSTNSGCVPIWRSNQGLMDFWWSWLCYGDDNGNGLSIVLCNL